MKEPCTICGGWAEGYVHDCAANVAKKMAEKNARITELEEDNRKCNSLMLEVIDKARAHYESIKKLATTEQEIAQAIEAARGLYRIAASIIGERTGHWMQTISGKKFYPLDPDPEAIDIFDIGYALARVCRFGGHCRPFYSVADHSIRVSEAIRQASGTREEQLFGLLHDAAEAYLGDVVWPLKQAPELAGYKTIEKRVEQVILQKFGLPIEQPPIVKRYDLVLLSTEKRDLMSENDGVGRQADASKEARAARSELGAWHSDAFEPLAEHIVPRTIVEAEIDFMVAFERLVLR